MRWSRLFGLAGRDSCMYHHDGPAAFLSHTHMVVTMTHETCRLDVALGERSYPILIGHGNFASLGGEVARVARGRRVGLVSDTNVSRLYGEIARTSLESAGLDVTSVTIPAGEEHKTLDTVSTILDALLEARLDRHSVVVALGGGVVGDMAGFAAAILLRGVDCVQVPTTIVAQVDSSVGGKTGVDHAVGKNLIGAFHQPRLVLIDTNLLRTLPDRELKGGMAEVIKHAIIRDSALFTHLEESLPRFLIGNAEPSEWIDLITTNCRIKAGVVAEDERESGLREILNCGHTVGHAVEVLGGFQRYRHGEGVAFGMLVEARIALSRGLVTPGEVQRLETLTALIMPEDRPVDMIPAEVWDVMGSDKKARDGRIRFAVPRGTGDCIVVDDISENEFQTAWSGAFGK